MTEQEIRERDEAAVKAIGFEDAWRRLLEDDTPTTRLLAGVIAATAVYLVESGYSAS